jgi:phage baseplate assembly protein V
MNDRDYGTANFESTGMNVIRSGRVTQRRITKNGGAQVKVFYPDREVESDWLPCGQPGTKGHQFYVPPPQIGDRVTVAHFPTGIERGVVLCSNQTGDNPCFTPNSLDSIAVRTIDGGYIEYDPDHGCFSINGVATVYINASGQVQIIAGGDLDVQTAANLNATVSGNLAATVSGTATITAPNIKLAGNVEITGTLLVDGNTTVQNINIQGTETGGGGT